MLFITNKPPLTAMGDVLHDDDLAEAIVDRVLEPCVYQSTLGAGYSMAKTNSWQKSRHQGGIIKPNHRVANQEFKACFTNPTSSLYASVNACIGTHIRMGVTSVSHR